MTGADGTASGGSGPLAMDLRRSGPLARFPAGTEARYRAWAVDQTRPVARIMASSTIPFWIAIPFFVDAWVDTPVSPGLYWVCLGVNVPLLTLGLLSTYHPVNRWQVAITSTLLMVTAFNSLLILERFFVEVSQAGLLATVIWINMLAPFARIPFRTTTVMTAVTTVVGAVLLVDAVRDQGTSSTLTWPYGVLLVGQALLVPTFALIGENSLRDGFVDSEVIARQRDEITAQRALIRRYVPPRVAEHLEGGDLTVGTPSRRLVTILFADVVGFTVLADTLDPEALARIVDEYLGTAAEIVEQHGGTLNEFAGDGVMALFGAPDEMAPEDQVLAAVTAAWALQDALPDLSLRWRPLGITSDLRARVGINTGTVSVGTYGSAVRATYTGIGLHTNIAARIQAECPPGSVLFSRASWELVKHRVASEPRGARLVKGVQLPVEMHEPVR